MARRSVAELEDELKQRDRRVAELRADLDRAEQLVTEMREQVESGSALIAAWIEAFDMVPTDDGKWSWGPFIDKHNDLVGKYQDLVRAWNRAVPEYNAVVSPRNVGRPLGADEAQQRQILKLHKRGLSLRAIAEETEIGLHTVRTIIAKANGADRAMRKRWQKLHPGEKWEERGYQPIGGDKRLQRIEVDRKLAASRRARKRTSDGLPKRIDDVLAKGRELVKAAKGLGR
jgi:hypothetical protein